MKLNKYFDSKYIFRIANLKDTKNIMNFLKDNWEPRNHILGSCKIFFVEFQNNSNLNFVVH